MKVFGIKNNLYVLRYNETGNYYVGTAINLEKRMLVHWRRESKLPIWSKKNKSKKGFKFYWFNIEKDGVSRSKADLCENRMAEILVGIIKKKNEEKFVKKIHVGNGSRYDLNIPVRNYSYDNKSDNSLNDIDKEIMIYLKEPEPLETKHGKFSIKCHRIGCVDEFSQSKCNKNLIEVVSFFER